MEEYKIADDKLYDSSGKFSRIIENKKINNFQLKQYENINQIIFINCHIKHMNVVKIKGIKLIFIDCWINKLKIYKSTLPKLQFIYCNIDNSEFTHSTLPGLVFSKNIIRNPEQREKFLKDITQNIEHNKLNTKLSLISNTHDSSVFRTKFIFCEMNEMSIDNTHFSEIEFKHCILNIFKKLKNVKFQNLDIRGTRITNSDFGKCCFKDVRFNAGLFLFEILDFLLIWAIKVILYFPGFRRFWKLFSSSRKEKRGVEIQIKAKYVLIKRSIKKFFHMIYPLVFVDLLSSTKFTEIKYEEADYSSDYHFCWYIQDLSFIESFKKRHPIMAFIFWITTNYMRSFFRLAVISLLVVFLFSRFYLNTGIFYDESTRDTNKESELVDKNGQAKHPFILSIKVFLNSDISPVKTNDKCTDWMMILEKVLGYFALGFLLSIIFFFFSRRTSLPKKGKESDFP